MGIDEVDQEIISLLRKNSLSPFVEIAKKIGVCEGTVRQRVKKLQQNGAIRHFTIVVDPKAVGLGISAFILLAVAPGHINSVAAALLHLEKVVEVNEIHTFGDLLLKVKALNLIDLRNIIADQIKTIQGVTGSQVISVLNVWKEDGLRVS